MIQRIFHYAILLVALILSTFGLAFAWPLDPPDRAKISGPGLNGDVQITDGATLAALKLGSIEDFDRGPIDAPKVVNGYRITRYFYGGEFNFGLLHYFPRTDGDSYIYFDDGPMLEGDHTAFHRKWFYAKPAGDAALRQWLSRSSNNRAQSNQFAPFDSTAPLTVGLIALAFGVGLVSAVIIWRHVKMKAS